jgi:hypothetical protein
MLTLEHVWVLTVWACLGGHVGQALCKNALSLLTTVVISFPPAVSGSPEIRPFHCHVICRLVVRGIV